jgi:phosphoglycerate dehydrogenase-like enzyme
MTPNKVESVLVIHDQPDDLRTVLCGRFPDVRFAFVERDSEVQTALLRHDPEAVFSVQHASFSGAVLRRALAHGGLAWFHVGGSGYDHLLPWPRSGVRVTTGAGVLAPFLAETVWAGILGLNANVLRYNEQRRRRAWHTHRFRSLRDQTLLVVGFGNIGRCVARIAKAFGMRVIAIGRSVDSPDSAVLDAVYSPTDVSDVVGQADVVSLHVRLTPETTGMVDERWLRAMKPGSILVNTSRGAVVDEPALIRALERNHLGGAYLDVFAVEPLPTQSPLWSLPNVLITPHAADAVEGWVLRYAQRFAENLQRWNEGRPLISEIPLRMEQGALADVG